MFKTVNMHASGFNKKLFMQPSSKSSSKNNKNKRKIILLDKYIL